MHLNFEQKTKHFTIAYLCHLLPHFRRMNTTLKILRRSIILQRKLQMTPVSNKNYLNTHHLYTLHFSYSLSASTNQPDYSNLDFCDPANVGRFCTVANHFPMRHSEIVSLDSLYLLKTN